MCFYLVNRLTSVLDIEYIDIGCWADNPSFHSIPTLEGRDEALLDIYKLRVDAVKKCAAAAQLRGYKVFALQDGGWCASSDNAATTYNKYGPSNQCKNDGKGGISANRVYQLINTDVADPSEDEGKWQVI